MFEFMLGNIHLKINRFEIRYQVIIYLTIEMFQAIKKIKKWYWILKFISDNEIDFEGAALLSDSISKSILLTTLDLSIG